MARDRIAAEPGLARKILVAGAIIHFIVCLPLYGRRGFPEVDPGFLAAMWLWIPPVCMSAVFSKFNRRRAWELVWYSLAAGFVISWGTIWMVPSYRNPISAFFGLLYYGPMTLCMVAGVELLSRTILSKIRRFVAPDQTCETCGYCLYGLLESRCPECGTSFEPELLLPEYSPRLTPPMRRLSTHLTALVFILGAAWPFAYRTNLFREQREQGRLQAEADWQNGTPRWYMTFDEITALPEPQMDRVFNKLNQFDPTIGFEVRQMWPFWQREQFEHTYRTVIEEKLKAAGRKPPSF